MAEITNLTPTIIKPSDVLAYEVNTDIGYGRETFNITGATTAKPVRVGTILVVDYLANTATPLKQTDIATLADTATLGVFLGRDLPTNPSTYHDYDRFTQVANGDGVAIVKGDGRSGLKKGYLDINGVQYYKLTATEQAKLAKVFTTVNRFKMVEQQYTPVV